MKFKLILIPSMVVMMTGYAWAQTFEEKGQAILSRINREKELPKSDWEPTGPTAEDIRAGDEAAARAARFFAKRDLGSKLNRAVENGDLKEVKTLITAGAELEVADYWGVTPLMTAAKKGYTDIVNMLINAGAHVDAKGLYGPTALIYAIDKGHTEIAKLLIAKAKNSCNFKALTSAIEKRNTEIVKILLANGAAQENQEEFGSLFFKVVSRGDNEMVKILMSEGPRIDRITLDLASMGARNVCSAEIVNAIEDLQKKTNS
ncbi:ankyrin repeat domain-containing protein [Candidatus Dependentiae bacterium]|nr:ankyrin repeat domain-containing protein [Candidatus Dependentiae bacterium]